MMTASLFSALPDAPAAASAGTTVSGSPAGGQAGSEGGTAFNALLVTLLPGAGSALLTGDLPAPLPAATTTLATDAGEALASLLPGLGLGDGTTGEPALAGADDADSRDDSSTEGTDDVAALVSDWLPALPLAAPLRSSGFLSPVASGQTAAASADAGAAAASLLSRTARQSLTMADSLPLAAGAQDATVVDTVPGKAGSSLSVLQAVADAAATPGSTPLSVSQVQVAQTSGWPLANQGLEGLLRSREGRLVQALDLPAEMTSLAPPGQPLTLADRRDIALISIPQHALQSPDWGDAFNQHLVTLAQQGTQSASLSLNPEDLGPIHVKISLHEQGASIEFAARHAATSELIESALPRLASALEAHGMRLDEAKVSQLSARGDGFSLAAGQQGGDPRNGQGNGQGGSPSHGQQAAADAAARQLRTDADHRAVARGNGLPHDDGSIDAYA